MKMESKRLGLGNPCGLRGGANLAPSAPRQVLRAWQPDSEKTRGNAFGSVLLPRFLKVPGAAILAVS